MKIGWARCQLQALGHHVTLEPSPHDPGGFSFQDEAPAWPAAVFAVLAPIVRDYRPHPDELREWKASTLEPITTAAAAAAGLFAVKLLEEAGSQTGKALSAAAGRLAAWVQRRGEQDPETAAAVTMVVTDPTDQTRIELLSRVLAARAAADPELSRELLELVAQTRQAGDTLVIRDQAQVGAVITGSLIGGQGGQGLAGGGGGGPAFGGGAGGDGGPGGNIYIPPGSPEPPVASGGGGGGGVIPIIREDGSVDLIGQPGAGGAGGSFLPDPRDAATGENDETDQGS